MDIGTLGGRFTTATDINDAGIIVGSSATVSAGEIHAFLKRPGEPMLDLTPLAENSAATRINALGQVLVTIDDMQFVYGESLLRPLGDLIEPPASEWDRTSFTAAALNDRGQIVGVGTMAGRDHGFLLTPVSAAAIPLPLPLLSGLTGLVALCGGVLCRGFSWDRGPGRSRQRERDGCTRDSNQKAR